MHMQGRQTWTVSSSIFGMQELLTKLNIFNWYHCTLTFDLDHNLYQGHNCCEQMIIIIFFIILCFLFRIDTCVGSRNHRAFLAAMFLFIACGYYGSHITMAAISDPDTYLFLYLLPSDGVYIYYVDYRSVKLALCLGSVMPYCIIYFYLKCIILL